MKYAFAALSLLVTGCTSVLDAPSSDIQFLTNPVYESANLPFSEAVIVDGWIILSGVIGTAPGSTDLAPGGIRAETRQVMENIKSALGRAGSSMDRIVKCTVMIDNISDWPAFNEIYIEYFDGEFPARSAFGADGLALGASIEVECLARQ